MHPFFAETMIKDHERELARRLARPRRAATAPAAPTAPEEPVTLRLACAGDVAALGELAALEGRPEPAGSHVVAEVEGRIVAALPLDGGAALGDPFVPTAHLVPLLELRAEQLTGDLPGRRTTGVRGALRGWSRA
jgi:hypothetical protein